MMTTQQAPEEDLPAVESQTKRNGVSSTILEKIQANAAVEARGIVPVPIDERTNRRTYSIFTLWFTVSTNLLPCVE